jgi:hypothetical protein
MLGLEGRRNFLLQHELLGSGRNYRVLDHEKRHLFTVRENAGQEMMARFGAAGGRPMGGFTFGLLGSPTREYIWAVVDPTGNPVAAITIQIHGMMAVSNLMDAQGASLLAARVERGVIGGLTATAAYPDGQAMFQTQGNLIRHTFTIHDPTGAEVAKIHEALMSLHDTYNLDMTGTMDPLGALVFAILIDREKQEGAAGGERRPAPHRGMEFGVGERR